MRKIQFVILFLCVLGAGFYYGSRPNTYAYKFFAKSVNRFPANESARDAQKIWEKGKLGPLAEGSENGVTYIPLSNPEQNICEFYGEAKSVKIQMSTDAVVFDAWGSNEADESEPKIRIIAEIDCDTRGPSPIFLKSFCLQSLVYYKEEHVISNTRFKFTNILDGFPKSWYIESADVHLRDGLSVVGIKPSQTDVKTFGKYTIECSSL